MFTRWDSTEVDEGLSPVQIKDTNHGFRTADEMWILSGENDGVRGEEFLRAGILEDEGGKNFAGESV